MDHNCIQEKELGMLRSSVDSFAKEIFNGPESLSKTVPALVTEVKNLKEVSNDLKIVISGLVKFMSEYKGREKEQLSTRQRTTIYVSAISAAGIIITSVILKFL